MLTFKEFKQKLAEFRARVQRTARPKVQAGRLVSSTKKKQWRRAQKTRARAACDSFRWRHKHNHHPSGRLHGWKGGVK